MAFSYITILLINSLTFPFFWQIFSTLTFLGFPGWWQTCKYISRWVDWDNLIYVIVGRGFQPPYFMKTTFSDFVQPPSFPVASNPTPPPLLFLLPCFIWLSRWSCHIWCAILLNDIIDLRMLSLGTLVPEGPWCVFSFTEVLWYSDLMSHTHTYTTFSRG